MTEPASVVAAQQLAEEAWARRAGIECATGVVMRPRKPHWLRTRRARAALLASAVAVAAGCSAGVPSVCSTIGYGSALVVELGPGWPAGIDRAVEVDCAPACPPPIVELQEATPAPMPGTPGTPAAPAPTTTAAPTPAATPVVPVDGRGQAVLQLYGEQPDEVTVRVREDGAVVAELTAAPEFVRIDGTEECGGNAEARIVVPAP